MEPEIKKVKKRKKWSLKLIHFSFGADADNDWRLVSVFFLCLFIIVIAISLFLFAKLVYFKEADNNEQTSFELIDRQKLIKIIETYDNKSVEFERIKSGAADH